MSLILGLRKHSRKFETVTEYLEYGIDDLANFVKNIEEGSSAKSTEITYIKNKLLPIIKDAKTNFNIMMDYADELLERVDRDFEECLAKLHRREKKLKNLKSNLKDIETELEGEEDNIREEEKRCNQKKEELSSAEIALTVAEEKVATAKLQQNAVVIGGFATAVGCAIITPFFPPAAAGVVAGVATEFSGIYLMEKATQECRDQVKAAKSEVSESTEALKKAQMKKEKTKQNLSTLKNEEVEAEEEINDTEQEIKSWKRFRNRIIEINECTKKLYTHIDTFCGRISVLCLETDGCYAITCLKSPTLAVCSSLSKLLHCEAIEDSCDSHRLNTMMYNLYAIESVKWPAIEYTDEYDDLV